MATQGCPAPGAPGALNEDDRVRVIGNSSQFAGREGVVVRLTAKMYTVRLEARGNAASHQTNFHPHNLELLPPAMATQGSPAPGAPGALNEDDRVRVIGNGSRFAGREGVVVRLTAKMYTVRLEALGSAAAHQTNFHPHNLQLVLPDPAPAAPVPTGNQVGAAARVDAHPAVNVQVGTTLAKNRTLPFPVRVYDFTAPVQPLFVRRDVTPQVTNRLQQAFAAHGGEDLYLKLTPAQYQTMRATPEVDHMAIDCMVAQFALNVTLSPIDKMARDLCRDTLSEVTKVAISRPEFLNPTHKAVNGSVKQMAVADLLAAVKAGSEPDIVTIFRGSYERSRPFQLLLNNADQRRFGTPYFLRSTSTYVDNTVEAVQTHAPRALQEVHRQLAKRVEVDGPYEAYCRNLSCLLECMGMVE
jgi:ribosomal protein L21E